METRHRTAIVNGVKRRHKLAGLESIQVFSSRQTGDNCSHAENSCVYLLRLALEGLFHGSPGYLSSVNPGSASFRCRYLPILSLTPKVQSLLRKMTLDEKVGQLVQYSAGHPTGPGTGRTDYEDMLAKGQIPAPCSISQLQTRPMLTSGSR